MNIGWVPGYSGSWQNTGKYLVNIGELDTYAEFLTRLRKMMGAVGACRVFLFVALQCTFCVGCVRRLCLRVSGSRAT